MGDGIELYGYGDKNGKTDFDQAFTPTSFKFDGEDDYITVKCDSEEDKNSIENDGLTFEFYGKLYSDGYKYNKSTKERINSTRPFKGLFCYWSGNDSKQANFRFGFYSDNRNFSWSFALEDTSKAGEEYYGPQCSDNKSFWNQKTNNDSFNFEEDVYLTIVVNPGIVADRSGKTLCGDKFENNPCIKQNVFLNGVKITDGWYNKKAWDENLEKNLDDLKMFCIGTCSMIDCNQWWYSHLECYSLRFYNRALNDSEVESNREKTMEYHKILESQNKKKIQQ